MKQLKTNLESIGDLERMSSRLAVLKISPRELNQLKSSLEIIKPLKEWAKKCDNPTIKKWAKNLLENSKAVDQIKSKRLYIQMLL